MFVSEVMNRSKSASARRSSSLLRIPLQPCAWTLVTECCESSRRIGQGTHSSKRILMQRERARHVQSVLIPDEPSRGKQKESIPGILPKNNRFLSIQKAFSPGRACLGTPGSRRESRDQSL